MMFCIFFNIFEIFWIFLDFFGFLVFLSKLLRFLIKFTKVTTGHQKLPKLGQNSIKSFILPKQRAKKASAKGQSPPQELEVRLAFLH